VRVSHVYCPECGFQNPEAANYCARCGTLLVHDEPEQTTMALTPDAIQEETSETLHELGIDGPALVVRAGGGRAGEHFLVGEDGVTIGRTPDCDVFLDDVTVSRRHAVVARADQGFSIEDLGSLNGTFVNRRRIESAELTDGDEIQIGKYRLTFLTR
jgi:pSer/pThr/pTyr-binding forkhead associated (FHA) protein